MKAKTDLKQEIVQLLLLMSRTPVPPAPAAAAAGPAAAVRLVPGLLHLVPEEALTRVYGALSAKTRDSAPPPDSALRRELLHLLQVHLGFMEA